MNNPYAWALKMLIHVETFFRSGQLPGPDVWSVNLDLLDILKKPSVLINLAEIKWVKANKKWL